MKPGYLVTLSDGVTTREHTVQNLAITEVDAAADIVTGTADGGTLVRARYSANIHFQEHSSGCLKGRRCVVIPTGRCLQ